MATKKYLNNFRDVFSACLLAVEECGFKINDVDEEGGIIEVSTPSSIRSWGEKISIEVVDGERDIEVEIKSNAKSQLFDWGKSQENISILFEEIEKVIRIRDSKL